MICICYSLSLPAEKTPEQILEICTKIRMFCLDRGFSSVGTIFNWANKIGFTCQLDDFGSPFRFFFVREKESEDWTFNWESWPSARGAETLFTACYIAVLEALKNAEALGVKVEVSDEGGYWKNRNKQMLLDNKRALDAHTDLRDILLAAGRVR